MIEQSTDPYWIEVYRIAKLLAKSYYGYAHDTSPPEVQEQDAEGHIPQARVIVAEMATAFDNGFNCGKVADLWENNVRLTREEMKIVRGLISIPESEKS